MGRTISFTVPAVPVAQPRQRHRVMNLGGKFVAQNYTPKNSPVNAYKACVQEAARAAYDGPPLDGPLSIAAVFVFARPQGMRWKTKPMPRVFHSGRPDGDNLLKSLTDAINGLVVVDDARFSSITIYKFIAAGDEQPHCAITISELETAT